MAVALVAPPFVASSVLLLFVGGGFLMLLVSEIHKTMEPWISVHSLGRAENQRFRHCPRSYGFSSKRANSFGQSASNLFSNRQLFHGTVRLARPIT